MSTDNLLVSVSNGDLKYASYPLLAGHFCQDGLFSAEGRIDQYMNGELGRRLSLGLYPGDSGSSEYIAAPAGQPFRGAVIAGLGRAGELTPVVLRRAVELAVLRYLAGYAGPSDVPAGLSALAIGCGYGGLGMEHSVRAVIKGVQCANDGIRRVYPGARGLEELEFIEVYRDRARQLAHVLEDLAQDDSAPLDFSWPDKRIRKKPGGRDRRQPEKNHDWWSRIAVRSTDDVPGGATAGSAGLQFNLSTQAAREEQRSVFMGEGAVVGQMLEDLSKNDRWTPTTAGALFALLIPADLKDPIKKQKNISWILDKRTAAYPWELLQEGADVLPLSVHGGMIRQLATPDYRLRVDPVMEDTALVIGDPFLEDERMQLPSALEEAKRVNEVLGRHGFTTVPLFQESAQTILTNLFSRSFKIVHLAGHGVFNTDPQQPSGMRIGKDVFLTSGAIDQLGAVPELVFINCCYLGEVDGQAEAYRQNRYRLAASIAVQFIEIGVRAVIAAGWAVDDVAGLAFAEKFYDSLLSGEAFGESVLKARQFVYERYHQRNNTWGAYQCYGDPLYRLEMKKEAAVAGYRFVMVEEAEIELRNLLNQIDTGDYVEAEIIDRLQKIIAAVAEAGIGTGSITELEAFLYAGLNRYEDALGKFRELFSGPKAYFSGVAMEKYCNVRAKYALQQGRKDPAQAGASIREIENVIQQLGFLQQYGVTVERLNLLGSAYKRLAMLQVGDLKTAAYRRSAGYYEQAANDPDNKGVYYSLTNQYFIETALGRADGGVWVPPQAALDRLKEQVALQQQRLNLSEEIDYWDLVAGVNLKLCLWFLGEVGVSYTDVESAYVIIWGYAGHQGNKQAEIEQLEFLEDVLGMTGGGLAEDIGRLKERLRGLFR